MTRKGGGAALPVRRALLAAIVRRRGRAAAPAGVPVTVKFRMGVDDDRSPTSHTGRIAEDEGAAAVALHARTAEQHYAGAADWAAIAALKDARARRSPCSATATSGRPPTRSRMLAATGCDGVVVGRGCLGRPWLFGDLAAAFAGEPVPPPPRLGDVVDRADRPRRAAGRVVRRAPAAAGELRKHTGWYLKGYPVGPDVRLLAGLGRLDRRAPGAARTAAAGPRP